MLHTVSAKPYTSRKTCPQLSPPSTSSSPARNVSKRTRETLNVQRPARALPQISALSLRGKLRVFKAAVSVCPRCAEKEKKAAKLRKTRRKLCTSKRTASPQNSSSHILLSNPIVWPLPSPHPCAFVSQWRLPRKSEARHTDAVCCWLKSGLQPGLRLDNSSGSTNPSSSIRIYSSFYSLKRAYYALFKAQLLTFIISSMFMFLTRNLF